MSSWLLLLEAADMIAQRRRLLFISAGVPCQCSSMPSLQQIRGQSLGMGQVMQCCKQSHRTDMLSELVFSKS